MRKDKGKEKTSEKWVNREKGILPLTAPVGIESSRDRKRRSFTYDGGGLTTVPKRKEKKKFGTGTRVQTVFGPTQPSTYTVWSFPTLGFVLDRWFRPGPRPLQDPRPPSSLRSNPRTISFDRTPSTVSKFSRQLRTLHPVVHNF